MCIPYRDLVIILTLSSKLLLLLLEIYFNWSFHSTPSVANIRCELDPSLLATSKIAGFVFIFTLLFLVDPIPNSIGLNGCIGYQDV